jgi:hypothetical protein
MREGMNGGKIGRYLGSHRMSPTSPGDLATDCPQSVVARDD